MRRTGLADALAAIRASEPAGAAIEQRLDEIFALEADRVATAATIAGMVSELLAGHAVPRESETAASARYHPPAPSAAETAAAFAESARTPAPSASGFPDISHFIDEMLSHEQAPRPGARRAS